MHEPDWTLIRSFIAIAETGSLSAASRLLGLTQPTLGRHLDELEQLLGLQLVRRAPRGCALTDKGAALAERAVPMREAAAAFARLAEGSAAAMTGTVRIAASQVMATYALPEMLARLRQAEPGIEIELVASDRIENLLRRDADIAVRMVRPAQGGLVARHVADLALTACAATAYLDRRGRPRAPEELVGHDLVGQDRGTDIVDGAHAMGLAVSRQDFTFRTDSPAVAWQAVRAGLGIGFAQASLVARDNEVEAILPSLPLPALPVWLAVHEDLKDVPRIRRVLAFLGGELKRYASGPGRSAADAAPASTATAASSTATPA